MKVTQFFTGHGIVGVLLFLIGSAAHGGCLWWIWSAPYAPQVALVGAVVGSIAVLLALPMMLIGRAYDVEITQRNRL